MLGISVSSLYGAPVIARAILRGSHGIAFVRYRTEGFTVIPKSSSLSFLKELQVLSTGRRSTIELPRNTLLSATVRILSDKTSLFKLLCIEVDLRILDTDRGIQATHDLTLFVSSAFL